MHRARFVDVIVRRPDLRMPFPPRFAARLIGQTVLDVTRRAKYLVAPLSSDETLLMHLGMSGEFRVDRGDDDDGGADGDGEGHDERVTVSATIPEPPDRHDHVTFRMSSGAIVTFNDARRFGSMELVAPGGLASHPVLSMLGPEPLDDAFDAAVLARALEGKKTTLKAALLDQRVVAGLGNIYVSEALHVAGLSPLRRASTLATRSGAPRESAERLTAAIKRVLHDAIARVSAVDYRGARFRVYDREGQRCRRPRCPGTIIRKVQGGRSTFYCRICQR